jgi:hypothetical protein
VDALIDLLQGYGPSLWHGMHGPAKSFCTTTHTIHSPLANFVTCSLLILDLPHIELQTSREQHYIDPSCFQHLIIVLNHLILDV